MVWTSDCDGYIKKLFSIGGPSAPKRVSRAVAAQELQVRQLQAKDAQMKQVAASSIVQQQRRIDEQDVEGELRKARAQADQMGVLRSELAEQEELWRQAYDKLARENEKLRGEGSEAALAAQWRQRYEQCMREKEDVSAKLQMLKSGNGSQRSVDLLKRYQDLKDEYKMYRKKAMEALQEKDVALTQSQAEANMGVRGIAR